MINRPIKNKLLKSIYLHIQNPTAFGKEVPLEWPDNFQIKALIYLYTI